jgi:hypothetical protein
MTVSLVDLDIAKSFYGIDVEDKVLSQDPTIVARKLKSFRNEWILNPVYARLAPTQGWFAAHTSELSL